MRYRLLALVQGVLFLAGCQKYVSCTDTINVNGQELFYAVEGRGKPVVLLHGNQGSHSLLETTQRQLAQAGYLVYALDSRGQGANAPLEEYHYKDMAADVHAFIEALGLKKPAVYGWSDGGIIALEMESAWPGTCSLIVTSGANVTADNAIVPEVFTAIFGDATKENADNLSPLVKMMLLEPNMTAEDISRIKCPVLVCAGENDLILPEHSRYIADSLPDARLEIVPDADHGSYVYHNTLVGDIILAFFKEKRY